MVGKQLHHLARLYGVQSSYMDAAGYAPSDAAGRGDGLPSRDGHVRTSSGEALLAVLAALGSPVRTIRDAGDALRWRRREICQTIIRPVTVAWSALQNTPAVVELRIPAVSATQRIRWGLTFEDGGSCAFDARVRDVTLLHEKTVEGVRYAARRLTLPAGLPLGYHQLRVEVGRTAADAMLIVAPLRACVPDVLAEPSWGAFLPLHSLWRRSSWGAGDLGDLDAMVRWTTRLGGKAVGMLPMLAMLWELGEGPSPYEPTSRLFWNEVYLDVESLSHLSRCAAANDLLRRSRFRDNLRALRGRQLVEYEPLVTAKRQIVAALAESYFAGRDRSGLADYRRRKPLAESFAKFRAVGQFRRTHWDHWPERPRRGGIRRGDYDEHDYRYYLYSQWQADEQLRRVAADARAAGAALYMDLPLGVRADGFDVWRNQDMFVGGIGVGAPPDTFAVKGQNWRFPPIHPHKQRQAGYSYFRACLRTHLEHAQVLRLDHVMGMHRLYWIPDGMEPSDGVYVRYPSDELLAIVAMESHRHQAMIVGENLGTVPPAVNASLARRGICSMYIVPFEASAGRKPGLRPIGSDCVAGMNTHDLPSFAAFWDDLDIDERLRLGLLSTAQARAMRGAARAARRGIVAQLWAEGLLADGDVQPREILEACLEHLGASDARLVMVNLEDLWGETHGPNLPGAPTTYPNWRRRARFSLEAFSRVSRVVRCLQRLGRARRACHGEVTQGVLT